MKKNIAKKIILKTKYTRLVTGIRRRKRKKVVNMGASDIKIFLKIKNKGWLSIEKSIMKCGKVSYNNFSN